MFNRLYHERKLSVRRVKKQRTHFLAPMVHWSLLIAVLFAVTYFSK